MLTECELAIKEETQISPGSLGDERGVSHKRSIPQIDGRRVEHPTPRKMKSLQLVMFQNKPESGKGPV
jgi:hypothetical protein